MTQSCGCPDAAHIPGCSETTDSNPEETFSHWPMHNDGEVGKWWK